jgi:hypothetical protein
MQPMMHHSAQFQGRMPSVMAFHHKHGEWLVVAQKLCKRKMCL